jgi:hypothetical protein
MGKLRVELVTRDLADLDKPPTINKVDWVKRREKNWAINHIHWAINNNRTVTISASDD